MIRGGGRGAQQHGRLTSCAFCWVAKSICTIAATHCACTASHPTPVPGAAATYLRSRAAPASGGCWAYSGSGRAGSRSAAAREGGQLRCSTPPPVAAAQPALPPPLRHSLELLERQHRRGGAVGEAVHEIYDLWLQRLRARQPGCGRRVGRTGAASERARGGAGQSGAYRGPQRRRSGWAAACVSQRRRAQARTWWVLVRNRHSDSGLQAGVAGRGRGEAK